MLTLLLAFPLIVAILGMFYKGKDKWEQITLVSLILMFVVLLLCLLGRNSIWVNLFKLNTLRVGFNLKLDSISVFALISIITMNIILCFYCLKFLKLDREKKRFFFNIHVLLFLGIGTILANDMYIMFFFWILVGCIPSLFIPNYEKKEVTDKKSLLSNQISNVAFLIGIIWLYSEFKTSNLSTIYILSPSGLKQANICVGLFFTYAIVGKVGHVAFPFWKHNEIKKTFTLLNFLTCMVIAIYFAVRVSRFLFPNIVWLLLLASTFIIIFKICVYVVACLRRKIGPLFVYIDKVYIGSVTTVGVYSFIYAIGLGLRNLFNDNLRKYVYLLIVLTMIAVFVSFLF